MGKNILYHRTGDKMIFCGIIILVFLNGCMKNYFSCAFFVRPAMV